MRPFSKNTRIISHAAVVSPPPYRKARATANRTPDDDRKTKSANDAGYEKRPAAEAVRAHRAPERRNAVACVVKRKGSLRTLWRKSAARERDDPAFRGLHRSTSGDGGLSCRVRHGTGRSPPPWSRSRGALPARSRRSPRGRPEGRMALLRRKPSFARDRAPGRFRARMARARAISTARLNASRRLQLRPIDLVVYEGPYRRENSSRRRLPA